MIVRTSKDKDHPYVLLNKSFLEDINLSLKAKGLLAFCMSKPDGWKFHITHMMTVLKEGREALYSAFKELIKFGYCVHEQGRIKGKFGSGEYILYEVPIKSLKDDDKEKKPHTENPHAVNAGSENTPLVINDNSNNDNSNIILAQTAPPLRKKASQILFSFEERKFLNIQEIDMSQWKEVYSAIDIHLEIKKMIEWCLSNPKKAASKKLWRKFITSWLSSANEKTINQQAYRSNNSKSMTNVDPQENKKLCSMLNGLYTSDSWRIDILSNRVEFVPIGCQGQVKVLNFTDNGFKEQIESILRKNGFKKR